MVIVTMKENPYNEKEIYNLYYEVDIALQKMFFFNCQKR